MSAYSEFNNMKTCSNSGDVMYEQATNFNLDAALDGLLKKAGRSRSRSNLYNGIVGRESINPQASGLCSLNTINKVKFIKEPGTARRERDSHFRPINTTLDNRGGVKENESLNVNKKGGSISLPLEKGVVKGVVVNDCQESGNRRKIQGRGEKFERISTGFGSDHVDKRVFGLREFTGFRVKPRRGLQKPAKLQTNGRRRTKVCNAKGKADQGYERIYPLAPASIFESTFGFWLLPKQMDSQVTPRPLGQGNRKKLQSRTFKKNSGKHYKLFPKSGLNKPFKSTCFDKINESHLTSILLYYVKLYFVVIKKAQIICGYQQEGAPFAFMPYLCNMLNILLFLGDTGEKRPFPTQASRKISNNCHDLRTLEKYLISHYSLTTTSGCDITYTELFGFYFFVRELVLEGAKKTILIVDDERFVLSAASRILEKAGFVAHTCELWGRVPSLIRNIRPNLVLLDYNMPSLKGDAICKIIKQSSIEFEMKVVFFSAEDEEILKKATYESGADGYIPKNLPHKIFIEKINSFIDDKFGDATDSKLQKPGKVLLIDDSDVFRRLYKMALSRKYNCQVLEAVNGKEGMTRILSIPLIDLILLDINMPVMNGIQFMETIREDAQHKQIPVIVCSTEDRETDILRALNLGAKGYMVKPFSLHALYTLIDRLFEE